MLDPEARKELRTLSRETSDLVARHLVVTGQLLDEDPEQALAHARAARALAGRVGVVREAAGLAAYAAGSWAEALSELRAARRITGEPAHLAVAADCERALGRPERALAYADDPDVAGLPQEQRVELIIVLAGARRDLGQPDAAVLVLQEPARRTTDKRPWAARLWYAYADALLAAGRTSDAAQWFERATATDVEGATDAGDRLLALQGVVLDDPVDALEDEEQRDDLPTADELARMVRDLPTGRSSSKGVAAPDADYPDANSPDAAAPDAGAPNAERRTKPTPAGQRPSAEAETTQTKAAAAFDPASSAADEPSSSGRKPLPAPEDDSSSISEEAVDEPAPLVTPRGSVAAPSFVAPPPTDDQDLQLFD